MTKQIIIASMAAMLLVGCSSSPGCATPENIKESPREEAKQSNSNDLNIPAFPYKPIIGTRNNDAKTIVDHGVVLKVYIATYKDSKKDLIAAHDKYVWAKEPQFVVGIDQPEVRKRTGMMTPVDKVPFVFGAGEIDSPNIANNEKIKEYLKNISEAEKRNTQALSNINTADSKFDQTIKNYIGK